MSDSKTIDHATRARMHAAGPGPRALGVLVLAVAVLVVSAVPASAIPAFGRREGQACTFCHTDFPKLNETGMLYQSNGLRFPGQPVQNVWDLKGGPPIAVIAEIQALYSHAEIAGQNDDEDEGPDIEVDEIEIMAAGNFSSRVSGFAEVEIGSDGEVELGPTWAQVNDLLGQKGEGNLNLRIGRTVPDLPFFSQHRRVIEEHYLAHDRMRFLGDETGVELNGNVIRETSSDQTIVHRYGMGVARTDRGSINNFRRGYAYYALELPDRLHFGALVQGGQERDEPPAAPTDYSGGDQREIGVLVGAEKTFDTPFGRLTTDLAYAFQIGHYRSLARNRDEQNLHDAVLEVLLSPIDAITIGTRVDWLIETEQARQNSDGWRLTELVRWNVIENASLGLEFSHEEGGRDSPVTGDAKRIETARLFVAVGF